MLDIVTSLRLNAFEDKFITELCIFLKCSRRDLFVSSVFELHKDFKSKYRKKAIRMMNNKQYHALAKVHKGEDFQEYLPMNTVKRMINKASHSKFITGGLVEEKIENEKKKAKELMQIMNPAIKKRIKREMVFVFDMTLDKLDWIVKHRNQINLNDFNSFVDLDKNKFKLLPENNIVEEKPELTLIQTDRIEEISKQMVLLEHPHTSKEFVDVKIVELKGKMLGAEGRRQRREKEEKEKEMVNNEKI